MAQKTPSNFFTGSRVAIVAAIAITLKDLVFSILAWILLLDRQVSYEVIFT
jgi:hypothetical protein